MCTYTILCSAIRIFEIGGCASWMRGRLTWPLILSFSNSNFPIEEIERTDEDTSFIQSTGEDDQALDV